MSFLDLTYKQAIKKAEHLKALGYSEFHISDEAPYEIATGFEPGGGHRLDISTSGWFTGVCPETGLRIRWSFDLEPRDANGSGSYRIDAGKCRRILGRLQGNARAQFAAYLRSCVAAVERKAADYQAAADRQNADATVLRSIAQGISEDL